MNYEEARSYLNNAALKGSVYGLESITALLEELSNPQDRLKFIHISGTNGKGSTLAFISTILKTAGYKVGRYVSPTVVCYRERIQINEEYIEKEALARLTSQVAEAVDRVIKKHGFTPTAFEIETAISFLYFVEKNCDIVTLETGLGGLTDATNVVTSTILAVIASISKDHTALLGDSYDSIAYNKAGIIKPGIPVVTTRQNPEAYNRIEATAKEKNSKLTLADSANVKNVNKDDLTLIFDYEGNKNTYKGLRCNLSGIYQLDNACLAIEAIDALRELGYNVEDDAIYAGIKATKWVGRFTKIHDNPTIIIDGAHNPGAALKLRETVDFYFTNKPITFIMGVLKDKEYDSILEVMLPCAKNVVTITPNNPRALDAESLAKQINSKGVQAVAAGSVKEAISMAIDRAGKDSIILSFGSLYYLGEVIEGVNEL